MPQLPKIVLTRLKTSASAVGHPDPDVLTAFTEQSLPGPERALVVEHLARCGDCREVVALALPAAEVVGVPGRALPSRGNWLTWPRLRLGVVAAGIVVVAAVGTQQYRKHASTAVALKGSPHNEVETFYSPQPVAPPQASASEADASKVQNKVQSKDLKQDETLARPSARAAVTLTKPSPNAHAMGTLSPRVDSSNGLHGAPAGSAGGAVAGPVFERGPKMAMATPPPGMAPTSEFKSNAGSLPKRTPPSASAQENAPVPSVNETVEVQAQAETQIQTEAAPQIQNGDQNQPQVLRDETGQQQVAANSANLDHEVSRAKPSVETQGTASAALASAPTNSRVLQPVPLTGRNGEAQNNQLPNQWTINPSGGLQRSFDAGKTWQNVEVNETSAYSFALTDETLARESKVTKAEKKKKEKEAAANRQFRAVVAAGPEVWAGGTGGMLYHSVDGGEHWARIVLVASGAVVTGDITSVEFSDPQHGRITTSTSQVWTTIDGGKSWQH